MERAGDIQDLCLAAGIDPEHYLTFALEEPADDAEPVFPFAKAPDAGPAFIDSDLFARRGLIMPGSASRTEHVPLAEPIDFRPRPAVERPAMRTQEPRAPEPAVIEPAPAQPAARRRPAPRPKPRGNASARYQGVAFRAAAGGCGATTVAATVAHLLAARGEHIVVGDGSSLPMLPAHFGATHLSRGTWSLLPGRRRDGGAIHILSNVDPAEGASFADGWLQQEMETFAHPWNRMLLDVSSSAAADLAGVEEMNLMVVVVVHPDPAARVRLPLLLDEYAALGIEPWVLLNRFDADKPSHVALQTEWKARLGRALLDFEIRADEIVSDALNEGVTVDEFAPDSDVTADFRQLADWIQSAGEIVPMKYAGVRQGEGL